MTLFNKLQRGATWKTKKDWFSTWDSFGRENWALQQTPVSSFNFFMQYCGVCTGKLKQWICRRTLRAGSRWDAKRSNWGIFKRFEDGKAAWKNWCNSVCHFVFVISGCPRFPEAHIGASKAAREVWHRAFSGGMLTRLQKFAVPIVLASKWM